MKRGMFIGVCMMALAGCATNVLGLGGTSWKEEALLHDGSTMIVKRSVVRAGRHEIGQPPPIKEQSVTFTLPSSNQSIAWVGEFSEDVGYASLKPILIDVVRGNPYLLATPVACLSYNKWQRPNPPYVAFVYREGTWRQIALPDVPAELITPNLVISAPDIEVEPLLGKGKVSATDVAKLNGSLTQPQYKRIVREPLAESALCPDWSSPRYTSPKAPIPIPPTNSDGGRK